MPDSETRTLKETHAASSASRLWTRPHVILPLAIYALVTWLTNAFYMGDTYFYSSVVARVLGGESYHIAEDIGLYSLWDFGHLLWRPLGVLVFPFMKPLARASVGEDLNPAVTYMFVALNWLAGLLSVGVLYGVLRRVCDKVWAINVTIVAFIFAQAFLNYTQTGCSYIPALSLLLLGIYLLVRDGEEVERPVLTALLSALALTGAVGLWVPFVWVVPAALVTPLLLFGWKSQRRWRLSTYATLACGLFGAALFIGVAVSIGIYTVGDFKAWIVSASHQIGGNRGIPQVAFGFARSFINMGNDNVDFKRYLLADPYSPVSLTDLFRLSLWKIALFYLFIAAILLNLTRSAFGRRLLAWLALSGIPVFAFAFIWQGTVMERYVPWFPFLFPALAYALADRRAFRFGKGIALVFIAAMIFSNFGAMRKGVLARHERAITERVRELQPLVRPQGIVLVGKDELENFVRDFPFNPVNHHNDLRVYSFLQLGMPQAAAWQEDVAARTLKAWREGGEVFVSRRVWAERPRREWDWVEGADPRVRWADVYAFFAQLEQGQIVGGDDGFVLLARTPKNEQILSRVAASQTATHDSAMRERIR